MIVSFKHRGLKRLYEKNDRSRISANQLDKVELILADLAVAQTVDALNYPAYRLHRLRGALKDFHSIWVTGNWRITFRHQDGNVFDVDLVDYH